MTQPLEELLEQQIANLAHLSALLEQELHLISSRDAEALMNLLKEKEQTLDTIQQSDVAISKRYQALYTNADAPDSVTALIADAQKRLEDCQYQTQVNQKAVEQGQLRLSHLRNLMLEIRAKESLTYDKSGKPKGSGLGRGVSA
ncbi:flagellar protein FlgN [Aestuariibacter sp. A3R04]|uniref:flagellar protein FlgN n=1 Tax=Aestuariibacter sp. A3R04 TaxID=2841571 RepID=UPI001C0A120A|nr:flagellar protein FlgN [Aestuariibacter sp. A3R04]MBU3022146.1 flagellar protein FlgN [Aestuariibacter sp. A3R04]